MAYQVGQTHETTGVDTFTVPSGGVTKGKPYQIASGAIVVARETGAENAVVPGVFHGPVTVTKSTGSGVIFAKFGPVYYDDTNKVVTNNATGNLLCGFALEAVASASTSQVTMYLHQIAIA